MLFCSDILFFSFCFIVKFYNATEIVKGIIYSQVAHISRAKRMIFPISLKKFFSFFRKGTLLLQIWLYSMGNNY